MNGIPPRLITTERADILILKPAHSVYCRSLADGRPSTDIGFAPRATPSTASAANNGSGSPADDVLVPGGTGSKLDGSYHCLGSCVC